MEHSTAEPTAAPPSPNAGHRVALGVLLILLLAVALALAHVRWKTGVLDLFPQEHGVVRGLQAYQRFFDHPGRLRITLESTDPARTAASARALAEALGARPDIVSHARWQSPWAESPHLMAEWTAYLWLNQEPAVFSNRLDTLRQPTLPAPSTPTQHATAAAPSPASPDPPLTFDPWRLSSIPGLSDSLVPGSGEKLFASGDGRFRVVHVDAASEPATHRATREWLGLVRGVERRLRSIGTISPHVTVRYTGRPVFRVESVEALRRDLSRALAVTLLAASALFYLMHARWRPLLWLVALQAVSFGATLAVGGLILGELNVVSASLAAVFLIPAAGYGLLLYHRAARYRHPSALTISRREGPGIATSALTCALLAGCCAGSSLPLFSQWGMLGATILLLAAPVCLLFYLPTLRQPRHPPSPPRHKSHVPAEPAPSAPGRTKRGLVWAATGLALVVLLARSWSHPPSVQLTQQALRSGRSPGHDAAAQARERLGEPENAWWVLVTASSPHEAQEQLRRAHRVLTQLQASNLIQQFSLPLGYWPDPDHQAINRRTLAAWFQSTTSWEVAVKAASLDSNALVFAREVIGTWRAAVEGGSVFWPSNATSRWLLGQVAARTPTQCAALGIARPWSSRPPAVTTAVAASVQQTLEPSGVWVTGWRMLDDTLLELGRNDLRRAALPVALVVGLCLMISQGGLAGLGLTLGATAAGLLSLNTIVAAAGWSWNTLNLLALPFLLALGIDYSSHMLAALRREGGNARVVLKTTGRALTLSGAVAVAGFGALAFSDHAGLASVGKVCALGVALCYVAAVVLVPLWAAALRRPAPSGGFSGS